MKDGKHVILCVDDDKDLLDSMKVIIESGGYVVEAAPNGTDALRVLGDVDPDLIIVDLMMEEIDAGTQFVRAAKAAGCKAPMYVLSSVGDDLNANINYAELGLTGVLQKPVDPNRLLATIGKALEG
jgi:CheY-like chemotaxis protein